MSDYDENLNQQDSNNLISDYETVEGNELAQDDNETGKGERMFTKAEVEEIIKTRLARDRRKSEKTNAAAMEEVTAQKEEAEKRASEAESRFNEMEERERNLQAREQLLNCREYLHNNGLPEQLLEAIPAGDISEFEKRVNAIRSLLAMPETKHFSAPLRDSEMMNSEDPDIRHMFLNTPKHAPATDYSISPYRSHL